MNKITTLLTVILTLMMMFFAYRSYTASTKDYSTKPEVSPQNATYNIDGKDIKLNNGINISTSSDTSSKIMTKYFGNEANQDLNGDGSLDSVFFITQETGGTGIFYYIVASMKKAGGYVGSNAVFIGDRIAPQTISFGTPDNKNTILVNYADRKPTDSFTIQPSIGKTKELLFDTKTMKLVDITK